MNYPLFKDMACKEDSATCTEQETIFDKYKVGRAHLLAPFRLFETNSCTSCDEGEDSDSKEDQKIRGPYRKYSYEEKMMAVDRVPLISNRS